MWSCHGPAMMPDGGATTRGCPAPCSAAAMSSPPRTRGPAWLVLPTYDERDNLESLVRAALTELGPSDRVLVVDDSSPDGTGEIADRLAAENPAVAVLHRPAKEGLGRAYLAGFRKALAEGASAIIEMDSDFSHDPGDLPRLLDALEGADLALGSRYVEGGRIVGWGSVRRVLSRGGCWYARRLLKLPVRDLTGGFRAYSRHVLEALDLDSIRADGYAFQVELAYRAHQAGFRVTEIPIVFRERRAGRSKMTARIALEAAWTVPAIALESRRRRRTRARG